MRFLLGCAALTVTMCAGCTSAVIRSVPASTGTSVGGIAYGLPKGQIQLNAVRKQITADDVTDAQKLATDADANLQQAKQALGNATQARDRAQSQLDAARIKDPAGLRPKYEEALEEAVIDLRASQNDVEIAKRAKAAADKRLADVRANLNKLEQTITLKALSNVADPDYRYVAHRERSSTRDDNFKLTTSDGLLNTTTSESTGQAGAIIVNVVSAIAGAKGGTAAPGSRMAFKQLVPSAAGCAPFTYTAVFDPVSASAGPHSGLELADVDTELQRRSGQSLTVKSTISRLPAAKPSASDQAIGLAYRIPISVTVTVEPTDDQVPSPCKPTSGDSHASITTVLPDPAITYHVDVEGATFTKTKTDYAFKDGMLISYSAEHPSQAAAAARLPIDILKAIVEVPASILKLRVDYDSQAEALIKGQTNQMKAQVDLINAQKALEDAQRNAAADPSN